MTDSLPRDLPRKREAGIYFAFFVVGLLFNLWGTRVGWESRNMPGLEFRQAQTAISAYHIQQARDFSLAYPTPVLGKPWSIPMEFPLYQWTVVGLSDLTGLDLTKAGRVVSQACFYLCLPAVFLLLGRMQVAAGRRWLVLAVVVTCPFYIFYSRAFLMETMALMFGLWFWLAFEESVEKRSVGWIFVAMLAGSGAGLVKVTTFIVYLLPAGWWALKRLWQGRSDRRWRGDFIRMALAVALPFALTLGWLRFADATKALNASAQFLRDSNLRDFTLGTWETRWSAEMWRMKWAVIMEKLSWGPLLGGGLVLALLTARHRGADALRLLLWFGAVLVLFPVLYALHEYYFIANTLLLLMAAGLVLVGMAESRRPVWLVSLGLMAFAGGQTYRYFEGYYQAQKGISFGGDGLTRSLRGLTRPDEVLVLTGQDWNSMTPFYAERRALMIRKAMELNAPVLDVALAALAGEKIGALVLGPEAQGREELIRRVTDLGLDPQPLYFWHGYAVYLPLARRSQSILHLVNFGYDEITLAPGVERPRSALADEWFETKALRSSQREIFSKMQPQPVRFFSSYGPVLDGTGGVARFGAHPVTRLVFRLAAGPHTLMTTASFAREAYDDALSADSSTDGVEITFSIIGSGFDNRTLYTRQLEPYTNLKDRGIQLIKCSFNLRRESEVELFIGPGPNDNFSRDWVWFGPIEIK